MYFTYGYTRSSWYAEHTDPQKAMYAAEQDVQDEANRRIAVSVTPEFRQRNLSERASSMKPSASWSKPRWSRGKSTLGKTSESPAPEKTPVVADASPLVTPRQLPRNRKQFKSPNHTQNQFVAHRLLSWFQLFNCYSPSYFRNIRLASLSVNRAADSSARLSD